VPLQSTNFRATLLTRSQAIRINGDIHDTEKGGAAREAVAPPFLLNPPHDEGQKTKELIIIQSIWRPSMQSLLPSILNVNHVMGVHVR
jgi:hypothetical protein